MQCSPHSTGPLCTEALMSSRQLRLRTESLYSKINYKLTGESLPPYKNLTTPVSTLLNLLLLNYSICQIFRWLLFSLSCSLTDCRLPIRLVYTSFCASNWNALPVRGQQKQEQRTKAVFFHYLTSGAEKWLCKHWVSPSSETLSISLFAFVSLSFYCQYPYYFICIIFSRETVSCHR